MQQVGNNAAMTDIRDIKPALPLDQGLDWGTLVAAGLVLALAGLAVWHYWRATPQRRARGPLRRAWKRLSAEAADLDDREFAYRLAELLRRGLAWRTGIPALSMTTEEILPRLASSALPSDLQHTVADALSRADPARYAAPEVSPLRGGPGGIMPPGGSRAAPWPPEASSSTLAHTARRTDLATVRAVLRRGPWFP
jgi:hypothetical protein